MLIKTKLIMSTKNCYQTSNLKLIKFKANKKIKIHSPIVIIGFLRNSMIILKLIKIQPRPRVNF